MRDIWTEHCWEVWTQKTSKVDRNEDQDIRGKNWEQATKDQTITRQVIVHFDYYLWVVILNKKV